MTPPETNICVFAGSRHGTSPAFAVAARAVAEYAAQHGYGLVYGAGNVGLMNEVAEAALAAGVYVVGVIPGHLMEREVGHTGLSELHVVEDMLTRKTLMAERSDAFLALPGGLGTYDEIFEMLTWEQLDVHSKRTGVLNVEGYFDPLLAMIKNAVDYGFVRSQHADLLLSDVRVDRLIERLLPGHQ